jgi:hypothetical protein
LRISCLSTILVLVAKLENMEGGPSFCNENNIKEKSRNPQKNFVHQVKEKVYSWSYGRHVYVFYTRVFILGIRRLAKLTAFFYKGTDGIINGN